MSEMKTPGCEFGPAWHLVPRALGNNFWCDSSDLWMGKQILEFCLLSNGVLQRDMKGFEEITFFFSTTPR